ncbi:MAG: o-succinylbenzoate synthase [Acidimicrobiales bacterium]
MRLESIELRLVALPLVRAFRTSFGTETVHEAIIVRVETEEAEGYGECSSGAEPLYSSEFIASSWIVLRDLLGPVLLRTPELAASDVGALLRAFKGHRMAKSALEMAVLDAELRARGCSFQEALGGSGDSVSPGVSVGITETVAELLEIVEAHLADGYSRVKLKIEPGFDIEPVRAVRRLVGETFPLQVDANAAYSRGDSDHLSTLDELGLLLVEQPLAEEDLLGHVSLAKRMSTPICLDESILCATSATDAIELGACSIVNVKPSRVGGYLEAVRVHDACRQRLVAVWCGGMLETGIGRAANLALATLPGFLLPGDISATRRYYSEDITETFELVDGRIAVPKGPGLGVEVGAESLEELTQRQEIVRRPSL